MRRALALLGVLLVVREAHATQACNALKTLDSTGTPTTTSAPPVVYVTGPSDIKEFIAGLAPVMFLDPTTPTTIVYVDQTSCASAGAVILGTALPTTFTASYWDPNSKTQAMGSTTTHEEQCTLAPGTVADIGSSDVFAPTCNLAAQGLPAGIKEFQGPIQSMAFAVPLGLTETVISAQAAYLTFGLGVLPPWTDATHIFIHSPTSGTQQMIGVAIGVPAAQWQGTSAGSSSGVVTGLTAQIAQTDIVKSIGILSATFAGQSGVQMLAYQHFGQTCGYKPDVQPLDKYNTRNGLYAIWGPIHLFTQTDASGLAKNTNARNLISYLTGVVPPPLGVNLLSIEAHAQVVPPCAMNVTRTSEMGPMSPVVLGQSPRCACAFDQAAVGTTSCKTCMTANDCSSTQTCSFGYCEATQ